MTDRKTDTTEPHAPKQLSEDDLDKVAGGMARVPVRKGGDPEDGGE